MSWRRICAADSVAEGQLKKFEVDGIPVILANYGGGVRAFPPVCPHMEEPLEESGLIEGKVLTCTKHLWQWDLESKEMAGSETEKPMHFYDVKQEGGDILAYIEEEHVYDFDEEDEMDDDAFFSQ
jgi:toluene monooxygenase system ferredoxin subunit